MAIIKITDIENAIVSAVKAGITYLDNVLPWGELIVNGAGDLILEYPAVLVVHRNTIYEYSVSNQQDLQYTFGVIGVARNLRGSYGGGDKDARHGTDNEKGVYDIIEDLRALLTDSKVGLNEDNVIRPLIPVQDSPIIQDVNTAWHGIDFEMAIRNDLT